MNDVTFGCNGRDAKTWRLHYAAIAMGGVAWRYRGGVWCLWMLVDDGFTCL